MATLWDRERNNRTQAKKNRAAKKSGYTDAFGSGGAEEAPLYETGVLAAIHSNRFEVMKEGEIFSATLDREAPLNEAGDFAVGDRVFFLREEEGEAIVFGRGERTSVVTRSRGDRARGADALEDHVLCANVDVGIITVSVKEPDFHQRFIDRYLAILQAGQVAPLICLTKTDLSDVQPEVLAFYQQLQIPIVRTAWPSTQGMDELAAALRGKTAVFLGQSGVGKSTLMNALMPSAVAATGEVSRKTGKGQHTTTNSSLREWDEHSFIIDTPGIRSLGIDQLPKGEIRWLFPELVELAQSCRFSDCSHIHEPECAVRTAIEQKDPRVNAFRYASYLSMMQEERP